MGKGRHKSIYDPEVLEQSVVTLGMQERTTNRLEEKGIFTVSRTADSFAVDAYDNRDPCRIHDLHGI